MRRCRAANVTEPHPRSVVVPHLLRRRRDPLRVVHCNGLSQAIQALSTDSTHAHTSDTHREHLLTGCAVQLGAGVCEDGLVLDVLLVPALLHFGFPHGRILLVLVGAVAATGVLVVIVIVAVAVAVAVAGDGVLDLLHLVLDLLEHRLVLLLVPVHLLLPALPLSCSHTRMPFASKSTTNS
uniref:Uncharacterized protein n=1 Tax=Triticum urartu TaxID=4572 RepID=A0A8R7VJK4_TRIUA